MLKTRIIPCLDVIKNKVVKGVNFRNIRVMGNAVEMAKYYSLSGADELCMLDINASYQNRKTFIKTVESIAKVINIPLTCLLYTSPSPRDRTRSRMPSSA